MRYRSLQRRTHDGISSKSSVLGLNDSAPNLEQGGLVTFSWIPKTPLGFRLGISRLLCKKIGNRANFNYEREEVVEWCGRMWRQEKSPCSSGLALARLVALVALVAVRLSAFRFFQPHPTCRKVFSSRYDMQRTPIAHRSSAILF